MVEKPSQRQPWSRQHGWIIDLFDRRDRDGRLVILLLAINKLTIAATQQEMKETILSMNYYTKKDDRKAAATALVEPTETVHGELINIIATIVFSVGSRLKRRTDHGGPQRPIDFKMLLLLLHRQHRLGGHRRAIATTTWWLLLSIIWWTTTFLLEIQQIRVPFWCCCVSGYHSFRLPLLSPSRFTASTRPNPNRLLLSVQPAIPYNNNGTTPYYGTAKEDETEDLRLSFRTETNATLTADDNDRYNLINHSSGNNSRPARWNAMFEKLQEYKAVHGDCLVPSKYKCDNGATLGTWVVHQRSVRNTSESGKRHDEWRRQILDSIGFVWIVNERLRQLSPETGQYASAAERFNARWNVMFEQLKEYKKGHGHCEVPQRYECADGTKLGAWVSSQRSAGTSDIKTNSMRRQALDDIGFVWQVREPGYTRDEQWNDMFQLLQEYQAEHGDCLVPKEYVTKDKKPLGIWVRSQRSELASGKLFKDLYKDRLEKLQSIGFELRALPDDSDDSRWTRLFGQLVEYQRQHGDCLVPERYSEDQVLWKFVQHLRIKGDSLSRDRREQLDAIGFAWDQHEANWFARFHQLQQFQRQHGHCLVTPSKHDAEYPGLGDWVFTQRSRTMDTKRIQQLDSLGFVWDSFETAWNTKFHDLQQFQQQHGHCLVSRNQNDAEYPGLCNWVDKQRSRRRTMGAERIQQLDSIGFVWDVLDANWNAMFQKLSQYQEIHGDCLVSPYKHDAEYPGLGVWVYQQRRSQHTMDTERIQQLDSIGFIWDGRAATENANWNDMFEQLRQYQAIHGDCRVPRSYIDQKLANWVNAQRATRTRTKLSPDQRAKLQSIGFFP
jgi:Helicase associated domain